MLPWILSAAFFAAAAYFAYRLISLRCGIRHILSELDELLCEDTNNLISVSTGDRSLKRIAAELNRHLAQLKKLQRQYTNGDRELKDAVTNISHDLRTPLTAICGYLELLRREEKSDTVNRYIERIGERTEAMKRLTEELFRYSVIISTAENITPTDTDIRAVLEDSIAGFYAALTERGIEPVITLPENAVIRRSDRSALSRIYGNILNNALKYSDGDLYITMFPDGTTEFSNTSENLGGVDVGKLFDRFFSVEAAKNSTGLGLAISKALVEQMGGSISARMDGTLLTVKISWQEES